MTNHLPENTKWRIATEILEGDSFSKVACRHEISKAGAFKIFEKYKFKIFPLLFEREKLNICMNDINSLRDGWAKVKSERF